MAPWSNQSYQGNTRIETEFAYRSELKGSPIDERTDSNGFIEDVPKVDAAVSSDSHSSRCHLSRFLATVEGDLCRIGSGGFFKKVEAG